MNISRRRFVEWAATVSALAASASTRTRLAAAAIDDRATGFRPELLPTQKAVWDEQVWMAKLGPKYTGNKAHTTFVDFLATEFAAVGCDVVRDTYTLPRWDARRWSIAIEPSSGARFTAPVTSYFPYSGETSASGVSGRLRFAGASPGFAFDDLKGAVALIEFATATRDWARLYKPWGVHPATETFPASLKPARGGVNDLTPFARAGAVGVILSWTDISDANAADQYTPFSRPPQGIPGLYVGRDTGARLKALAADSARATVVLEADRFPDTRTDTLLATLPGSSPDEVIIVNTHTDGPNATEENGALGILALAKYFAKLPKRDRRRTLVWLSPELVHSQIQVFAKLIHALDQADRAALATR